MEELRTYREKKLALYLKIGETESEILQLQKKQKL